MQEITCNFTLSSLSLVHFGHAILPYSIILWLGLLQKWNIDIYGTKFALIVRGPQSKLVPTGMTKSQASFWIVWFQKLMKLHDNCLWGKPLRYVLPFKHSRAATFLVQFLWVWEAKVIVTLQQINILCKWHLKILLLSFFASSQVINIHWVHI